MRQIALGILATLLLATSALAQEPARTRLVTSSALGGVTFTKPALAPLAVQAPPAAEPATPPVSVSAGIDFPSLYMFRGIRQEADPSFTAQPFVELDATAGAASFAVGSWNSFNWGSNQDVNDGLWYESDVYASVGFTTGKVSPTILYTAYTSPNDGFGTVHELAFSADFDDSDSSAPMSPSVTVAFELGDNGADGGANKGIYLQLGIEPAIPTGDSKLSLSVPVTLGMSLKDYYEGPNGDSKFGYLSGGLSASVDLGGGADVHGSVLVYGFGDTLKAFNNDKASEVVGSIGIGVGF
jgi:hypothetical protein